MAAAASSGASRAIDEPMISARRWPHIRVPPVFQLVIVPSMDLAKAASSDSAIKGAIPSEATLFASLYIPHPCGGT